MEVIENYGILASISWNSNGWSGHPTKDDLTKSKYDFVKGHQHMHESLNFAHDVLPAEDNGCFIAYTPMFNRLPALEKSKHVSIVFFTSSDYKNGNRKCIVGFYGMPEIDQAFNREAKHALYKNYDFGNVRSEVKNIIYFKNPLVIDNSSVQRLELLPLGKKISQQGFNYLHSDNVNNILRQASLLNPNDKKLSSFLKNFPLDVTLYNEYLSAEELREVLQDLSSDTLADIEKLEQRMKNLTPVMKERVSNYIERGTIAKKVKQLTGFKCCVCEAFGMNPIGFMKTNGDPYVETHHVEPVHKLARNSLSVANLMTICANHHRQMHYGDVKLLKQDDSSFQFAIEGQIVSVRKIKV